MNLKGSQTEKNLMISFLNESKARNMYDYFANKAEKEGYQQISYIFAQTAEHERIHAKNFLKHLSQSKVEIETSFESISVGTTEENLFAAVQAEKHETQDIYPRFANIARQEGFEKVANLFEAFSVAEKFHLTRFERLLNNIKNNQVFKRSSPKTWFCTKCGYLHNGEEALDVCPACNHPKGYFEILADNY